MSSAGTGRVPDGGSWWKRYNCGEESAVQRVYSENNEGGMGIDRAQQFSHHSSLDLDKILLTAIEAPKANSYLDFDESRGSGALKFYTATPAPDLLDPDTNQLGRPDPRQPPPTGASGTCTFS